MIAFWIALGCLFALFVAVLVTSYICFCRIFYVKNKEKFLKNEDELPAGKVYEAHREGMLSWMRLVRRLPYTDFSIQSHDGLTLWGRYYETTPGAPIEIMLHGYRGHAERELSAGVLRARALNHNALLLNLRASERSGGNVVTFGVLEKKDTLLWAEFVAKHFGRDVPIILTGLSMGAATVMMCAGEKLPENVIGVLADCGYTSAKDIIQKVIRERGLPATLLYPFARLGARIFGHFDPEEDAPIRALTHATVPVFFVHGDSDDFVPHTMSVANYEACSTKKRLLIIESAGHGLAYPIRPDEYISAMRDFFTE